MSASLAEDDAIAEAAATWLLRLQEAAPDPRAEAAWRAWRGADPRHETAWREMEALWCGSAALRPALKPEAQGRTRRAVIGAGVVALGLSASLLCTASLIGGADSRTGIGERRRLALPDGSLAELDAATALSFDFSGTQRRLTLREGQVFLQMTADPARPFALQAAGAAITGEGARFNLNLRAGGARLEVAEGRLRIEQAGRSVTLGAGQGLRYGPGGLQPVTRRDPQSIGSWRQGMLIFQEAPLGEVVADLARYRHGFVLFRDASLAELPVTGMFRTDQGNQASDEALAVISRSLPLRLRRFTPLLVLIDGA